MKLRLLSADEVRAAMPMAEAIRAVRQAFVELSAGRATMPVRARVDVPSRSGISLYMPGYLAGAHQLATKIVGIFPDNLTRTPPLPTINALVVVLDPDTGLPAGAIHGGVLTAIRTGAASGVATEELARDDVRTAGVLGAGVQARTQLEAMVTARPGIESASVYDPRTAVAESFAADMTAALGIPVSVARSADEVVAGSEVIAEATTSNTPVWEETGDLIQPRDRGVITEDHILAEIGEISAGTAPRPDRGPTLFKTVGTAVQDVAVGAAALARAEEHDLGTVVEL